MKLIIQIPCFNEAETLPQTLAHLPRSVAGFSSVEWMVINDGSADDSRAVARAAGVDHLVELPRYRGLANAFSTGLQACLDLGADVIVNTDTDNQYSAEGIPDLVRPILDGPADIVIGTRPINQIQEFSALKKVLHHCGSRGVRWLSGSQVLDVPCGFRAYARQAAARLHFFTRFSHTLETILQAGQKGLTMASVPIQVNPQLRPSRLVRSIPHSLGKSIATMARVSIVYHPFRFFSLVGGDGAGGWRSAGVAFPRPVLPGRWGWLCPVSDSCSHSDPGGRPCAHRGLSGGSAGREPAPLGRYPVPVQTAGRTAGSARRPVMKGYAHG